MRKSCLAALIGLAAVAGLGTAKAQSNYSTEPYFANKVLTIIVGYPPAGGYASYATIIAKHLRNHLQGAPSIIIKHMPGAGSLVAGNQLYNLSKPDGLTIASINLFNLYTAAMTGADTAKFDLAKFEYIGNGRSGNSVLLGRADSYPSLDSLRKATKPVVLGVAARGDGHHVFGHNMESGFGIPFKFISGYGGGGQIDLAFERKEIDVRVANLNSYLISKPEWLRDGFARPLVQSGVSDGKGGVKRDARIPEVPTVPELFPSNQSILELESFSSLGDLLNLVYLAPPGTPRDILDQLRTGFMATLGDPAFLADAEKFNLDITPMDGGEVEAIVKRSLSISPKTLEIINQLKQ